MSNSRGSRSISETTPARPAATGESGVTLALAVLGIVDGPSSGSTLPWRSCGANSAKDGLACPSLGILYPSRTAHLHPSTPKTQFGYLPQVPHRKGDRRSSAAP